MSSEDPQKVLVVDHDPATCSLLTDALGKKGIQVIPAGDLSTALYQFNHQRIDVAVVDAQQKELKYSQQIEARNGKNRLEGV